MRNRRHGRTFLCGTIARRFHWHKMATLKDVRRIALSLPGVVEDAAATGVSWRVNDKLFVWERPLKKADLAALGKGAPDGPIFAVRTPDLEMKELLIQSDPGVLFTTPHFDGYPAVLIALPKIKAAALKRLVIEAWLARAPKRAVAEFLEPRPKRKMTSERVARW